MLKEIIIRTGVVKEVSFEEILKLNKGLIGMNIKKWHSKFEYEDLYQMCLMALWQAYSKYDIKTGFCFGTIAGKYIFYTISAEYRMGNRHHVAGESLEKELQEGITLESKISGFINPINESETNIYVDQLLNNKERIVLRLLSENYTQKQVAKALSVSQAEISRILSRIRKKFTREGYRVA